MLDRKEKVGYNFKLCGGIAQLARAHGSYPWCREFKSPFRYEEELMYRSTSVFLCLKNLLKNFEVRHILSTNLKKMMTDFDRSLREKNV